MIGPMPLRPARISRQVASVPWRAETRARFPSQLHVCACARSGQCSTIVHRHHEEARRGANACRHERDDPGVVQSRRHRRDRADVSAHAVLRGRSSPSSPLLSSRRPAAMRDRLICTRGRQRIEDMAGAHLRDARPVLTRSASHRRRSSADARRAGLQHARTALTRMSVSAATIRHRIARIDAVQLVLQQSRRRAPPRPGLPQFRRRQGPDPRAGLSRMTCAASAPSALRTPNS